MPVPMSSNSSYPATDPELIAAIADHQQQDAWYEFERLYAPALLGTLRKRGFHAADAEDCCQRIFAKLILAAGKFTDDGQPAAFRRWLVRLARNETISFLRQQARHPLSLSESSLLQHSDHQAAADATHGQPAGHAAEVEQEIDDAYRKQLFLEAAAIVQAEVNPVHWQAFWRTMVEAEPTHVVASELKLSVGAVYVAKARVLKKLQSVVCRWKELG